jgi:tRNA dimethylallyltransferase
VGKSSLLYDNLADQPLYIISADSMQVYNGFDVATATPPAENLDIFPHRGINELPPDENYSVADFLELSSRGLTAAATQDRFPVIVGGTALYLKNFLFGLDKMPPADQPYRQQLRREAKKGEEGLLHARLKEIDPAAAQKIHPNDQRRIIRALEIYHLSGQTKSELISENDKIRKEINPLIIGLNRPADELKSRINSRVKNMVATGLVEEIKRLRGKNRLARTLTQAIGFPEVVKFLAGELDKRELIEEISTSTWQFARKQMTWFKRFPVEKWYHPEEEKEELQKKIEQKIRES